MANDSVRDLVDSIRTRLQAELDERLTALSARHDEVVAAARQETEALAEQRLSARLAERESAARQEVASLQGQAAAGQAALSAAFARVDDATSISALLSAIGAAAAAACPGAALFVGPELDRWTSNGVEKSLADAGASRIIARQAMDDAAVSRGEGTAALPLVLDGTAVAVVCAPTTAGDVAVAVELIVRHGAARLAALTAIRTAHARRWLSAAHPATAAGRAPSERKADGDLPNGAGEDGAYSARRYARLLVSEIKLYNETAVNEGRARRDLSLRLGSEIDRARRLYEERVPATVADRGQHFQHELIHTLAGGDPSLLG